jgi:pimeloyl-ACP methyl ester carboxylesterase
MRELTRRQVITALSAALLHAPRNRVIASALAAVQPGSGQPIDESGFVSIGGIDQWIAVRGRRADNPVIVFVHGGPGDAQSPFLAEFAPWEENFTVLTWDQRGSGKTYGRYGNATPRMATPEAALETLTRDAIEVADYARRRLRKERVVLIGHSWGSVVGLNVVKRRPELFHAYVASAFLASWPLTIEAREVWIRAQAKKAGDGATLKALDAAASLPIGDLQRFIIGQDYLMGPSDLEYLGIEGKFIGAAPPPAKGDVADWLAGFAFSQARALPAVAAFDARQVGVAFEVPFFVVQGRDDHVTAFAAAEAYVAEIHAPRKAFIAIDGGHFACFMDPKEFLGTLSKLVGTIALN